MPENVRGSKAFTIYLGEVCYSSTRVINAPNSARDTRQADPIANPLPIAAVVFPAASILSVLLRTKPPS
jgi:hypothetical protein